MLNILLTKYDGAILGPIAKVLGYILEALYNFFNMLGIANVGLCIIAFTFVIKMLMMPLTYKQQKFSKLSSAMNPEIQAIQKKYKDKKGDQQAMMKMQEETKMVYEKYGTSPTGSCLQMAIQMPILFALYRVMMNIPAYIPQLKSLYENVITNIGLVKVQNYIHSLDNMDKVDVGSMNLVIDQLAKFSHTQWSALTTNLGANTNILNQVDNINGLNSFFGINLTMSPMQAMGISLLIPVLSGVAQWYTTRLMQAGQNMYNDSENPMGNSMKMMNNIMPIFSAVICVTVSSGLGLYWIASSVISIIQQLIINAHFKKVEVNDLIKENIEKQNKKRAKKGLPPKKITNTANYKVKNIESKPKEDTKNKQQNVDEQVKKSTDYYNKNAKPGSIASKANMVRMYDEKKKNK